jgi:chemotaxis protein methyltransferase CheR
MNEPTTLDDEHFDRFLALIYRVSGIRIPTTKRVLVSNRLRRRLRATGLPDFAAYYRHLTSPAGVAEMPFFLNEITTNETYFFRDPQQYEWFGDVLVPDLIAQAERRLRPRRLRVWSAAASNGAELYSAALCLKDHGGALAGWSLALLGTDLSEAVLAEARAGVYDARALRGVDERRKKLHFVHDPAQERWTLRPEIRTMATWKAHNLMQPLQGEAPFDCVFLKNVLIYFDAASKQVVARHVTEAVAPEGWLVLGPTEMIPDMLRTFRRVKPWLYQKTA